MLTFTFSSPMPDVIKVSIVHFAGRPNRAPHFQKAQQSGDFVSVREEEDRLVFASGKTEAVIDKRPNAWHVEYRSEGKLLTDSGYRNAACMYDREEKTDYMVEQLLLDVGEQVYGLGERYTPFIKNGQEVQIWNEDGGTASEQTYKNIPFYVTSKGYGVFVDNPGDVQFEVGSEKVERVQFSMKTECLDYYIINGGTPKGTYRCTTD